MQRLTLDFMACPDMLYERELISELAKTQAKCYEVKLSVMEVTNMPLPS